MTKDIVGEQVLDLSADAQEKAFISKTTDPVILPQPYASPADFAAQYPTPLDPTEIIDMCEEVSMIMAIPQEGTALKQQTWRELSSLAFTSGSAYLAFADGECPEEYTHDGSNTTITLKNVGAKKSLSISDIMHSQAIAGANWHGINTLVGGLPASEGLPGGADLATFQKEYVAGVKAKEIRLAMTLVINGTDALLVNGDSSGNTLEFDGFETWQTNQSVTFHTNDTSTSGSFSAAGFDRFLSESCAKPTHVFGHPQAIQEMLSAYFQLGFAGSQVVNVADGNRITPGFNFAGFVNTGIGRLTVVSDNNFARAAAGTTTFSASLWAMRMVHNGTPFVYRSVQIPLALKDLTPGCTAVSFEVWEKSALVIKNACAHGAYTSVFTGRTGITTCAVIG